MEIEKALQAARDTHQSILVTLKSDGRPQLSNVLHTVDDDGVDPGLDHDRPGQVQEPAPHPVGGAARQRPDVLGVRRPRGRRDPLRGGRRPDDATVEELVELYRAISGEHDDWDDYRAAMVREQRVVVRLTPTRAYGALR